MQVDLPFLTSRRWLPAVALLLAGCTVSSEITDYCAFAVDNLSHCTTNGDPAGCAEAWQPNIDRFCEEAHQ